MRATHAARLWIVGGLLVALAIVAGGWLLLIGPQRAETADLEQQAADAQVQATVQRARLSRLREEQGRLTEFKAQLARDRAALPAMSAVSDYLRQLQVAGDAADVVVGGVTVDAPQLSGRTQTTVYELPVSLTVDGAAAKVESFLTQLQRHQPRAALVDNVRLDATDSSDSFAGGVQARVSLKIFVAPSTDGK